MTQTPDPNCPFCSGTGLTLLMEDCPCAANYFVNFVTPEPDLAPDEILVHRETDEKVEAWAPPVISTPHPAPGISTASPGQISFLETLLSERDPAHPTVIAGRAAMLAGIGKSQASKLIEALLKLPKTAAASVRKNRYAGECRTCGGFVEAEAGRIEKIDGKWKTFHLDGKCLDAAARAALDADKVTEPGVYGKDGRYYRVRPGRYDKTTFWAEEITVHPHDVTFRKCGTAVANGIRGSHRLDWKTARKLGIAVNACINCGKDLDLPQSVVAGYGKRCSETCGWPYPKKKIADAVLAGIPTGTDWDEEV